MAASDTDQILNLVLYAQLQAAATSTPNTTPPVIVLPIAVLTQLFLAAGPALASGGGRLVSASVNGKSFSYQVDPDLTTQGFLTALRGALAYVGTYTAAQIAATLATPRSSVARITF